MIKLWHIPFYVDSVAIQMRNYCEFIKLTIIKTELIKFTTLADLVIEKGLPNIAKLLVEKYLPLGQCKNMIQLTQREGGRGISASTLAQNLVKSAGRIRQISTTRILLSPLKLSGFADYTIEKRIELRYNMVNAQTANNGRFLLRNKIC